MSTDDMHNMLRELIGEIIPISDAAVDYKIHENIKQQGDLVNYLLGDLCNTHNECCNSPYSSKKEGAVIIDRIFESLFKEYEKFFEKKPHVLTYEDLACPEGLQLLGELFPPTHTPNEEWGSVYLGTTPICFLVDCLYTASCPEFYLNGDSENMPANWQLILAGYNSDMEQVGHDWKLPNGETVKAIFVPKTPSQNHD